MTIDYSNASSPSNDYKISKPSSIQINCAYSDYTDYPGTIETTDEKYGYREGFKAGYKLAQERHIDSNLNRGFFYDYSTNSLSYYKKGYDEGYAYGYEKGMKIGQNNGLVLGLAMQPLNITSEKGDS